CLSLVAQSRQPSTAAKPRPSQTTARPAAETVSQPSRVLFVGADEETPHNPTKMFPLLAAPLARRGIQLTYGHTALESLDPGKLNYYDAVLIYGDQLALTPAQEKALTAFVDSGHGLIALHAVGDVPLIGARLSPQGGAELTAEIVQ